MRTIPPAEFIDIADDSGSVAVMHMLSARKYVLGTVATPCLLTPDSYGDPHWASATVGLFDSGWRGYQFVARLSHLITVDHASLSRRSWGVIFT